MSIPSMAKVVMTSKTSPLTSDSLVDSRVKTFIRDLKDVVPSARFERATLPLGGGCSIP